jgi:nitrate reductase gamma subunit
MNSKTTISIVAGVVLLITLAGLNLMKKQTAPPNDSGTKPLVCLDCHRSPNVNSNEGVFAANALCYNCHREKTCVRKIDGTDITLQVLPEDFNKNQKRHQFIACVKCHADVARSPHKTVTGATCLECHSVHGEGTAHDPHLRVSCQACHFKSQSVQLDPKDDRVKLARMDLNSKPVSLSDHAPADVSDLKSCEKCHFSGNPVGAPAAVLPSKSALCIVCHNSPLSMGHPIFGAAMLIFLAGVLATLRFWYLGSVQGEENSLHRKISLSSESIWNIIFSRQIFSLSKMFVLDIIFQRRILKESIGRWSMHSLIFSAILLRFLLSLFTALVFYFNPDGDWSLVLIDKNNPFTAFANDLLGLFILLGIIWAVVRRFVTKPDHVVSEYQDNIALAIIGILILLGFFLEGVRILSTGISDQTAIYSFVGYPLSKVFSVFDLNWAAIYPYLWYAHGIVGALFVAYLPFGKMRHIFNTPLTYALEAVSGVKNEKRI